MTAEYIRNTENPFIQIPQFANPVYIDARTDYALNDFCDAFYNCLHDKPDKEIVIICIGSDRATGDCFGPIVGHMLEGSVSGLRGVRVVGTLEKPVHAKNVAEIKSSIYQNSQPLVIAIDACLGKIEHVGFIGIGNGSLRPGAGLGKKLPEIGDIYITGVVNFGGIMDFEVLQNTRLSLVMRMSEIVHHGVVNILLKAATSKSIQGFQS